MGFWKALFGGGDLSPEEEKQQKQDKSFDLLKYDGVKAMRIGRVDYALRCFQEALKLKDDLETHDYLSQVLLRLGNLEEARAELQTLAAAQPQNVDILIRIAQVENMMDDYPAMMKTCKQAMDTDPSHPQPCFQAALARLGLRDPKGAVNMLDKAITLRDDYAEAWLLRGQIHLKTGNKAAAEKDVEWLTENVGEQEDVLLLKARLEALKGNTAEALAAYDKVTEVNPFSLDALLERAKLKQAIGDTAGAQADLAAARELTPTEDNEDIEQQVKQAYQNVSPFGI